MEFIETFNADGTHGSPKLPDGVKNYLIDIDGTICDDIPNEEPERIPGAKVFPGAMEKINALYDAGHVITFFTSRVESSREATTAWLKLHGFNYHNLLMNKPRGGNYIWIDDRDVAGVKFQSWDLL